MKNKQVVFWTSLNRAHFQDDTNPEWIKSRFELWTKTALKSILRQTHKDFIYLICCNKDTRHIIDPLMATITDKRVFVQYLDTPEAVDRIKAISKMADEIITIRLDSDDMYDERVAEEIVNHPVDMEWYFWKYGYGLRYQTFHMFNYDCGGSGPFFAHRYFDSKEFGEKTTMNEPSHVTIKNHPHVMIEENRFIVGVTNMNTTTNLRNGCFKKKITEPKKSKILKYYGMEAKEKISI